MTVSAAGVATPPQVLDDDLPDEYMNVHVAPGGQAAITFSGAYLAYRSQPSGPFEPTVSLFRDAHYGLHTSAAFDADGNLYLAQIDKPRGGGDEWLRTGFRPLGGALSMSSGAPANTLTTLVAPDPAGGAVAACDCDPDGALFTRAISNAGAFAAPVAGQGRTGTLLGWEIAPDGSRVGLWLYGRNLIAGARPREGAWTLTPLSAAAFKDAWLAVGPSGEAIAAWTGLDERLYAASTGSAPAPGAGATAPTTTTTKTKTKTRVPARPAIRTLIKQLRAGITADRRRVSRGRSLTTSRRATKALRTAVATIKPHTTATKRARRALLQGVEHRARALKAKRPRTAQRLLTLAAHDHHPPTRLTDPARPQAPALIGPATRGHTAHKRTNPRDPAPQARSRHLRMPTNCGTRMPLAELAGEAWTTGQSGMGWEEVTQRTCRALGRFDPDIRHRTNDDTVSLALVAGGHAVTLLPELVLTGVPRGADVRPIAEGAVTRTIFAATRVADAARPSTQALLAALRRAAVPEHLAVRSENH